MKNADCWSGMERLEERRLLAGNVTAEVVDGVLTIEGDQNANKISINDTGLPSGQLRLTGTNTTVNGQTAPVVLSGITNAIQIELGDGKDLLQVRAAQIETKLLIDSGDGSDDIDIADGMSAAGIRIATGAGNDSVSMNQVVVSRNLLVRTGGGNDEVTLRGGRSLRQYLFLGKGDDILTKSSTSQKRPTIDLGGGRDLLGKDELAQFYSFFINNGTRAGWRGGFADYFTGQEQEQELEWGIRTMPPELLNDEGLFIKGKNSTDDLFMFITRRVTLEPDTFYRVGFEIKFASNAPSNCSGIGGAPGESVFLKAGASSVPPRTHSEEGVERLNVDHGQQGNSGKDVSVVGNIANGQDCPDHPTYVSMTRQHTHPRVVKTNSNGSLYLIVGTESGFEGTTALYYQRIGFFYTKFEVEPRTDTFGAGS